MTILYLGISLCAAGILLWMIMRMLQQPKFWLGTVLLVLPTFMADSGVGLSVSEALLGAFILGSLLAWLVVKAATGYKFIRGWADLFLIAFVVLSIANIVVAVANGVSPGEWTLEWMVFLLMLYYFPFREYFGNSTHDLRTLLILCSIATLIAFVYSVFEWIARTDGSLIYAYQLIGARSRLFAPIFVMSLCLGLSLLFHTTSKWTKLLLFGLIMVSGVGIIQSMTRTLWAIAFGCVIAMMFFFSQKQNVRLVLTTVLLTAAIYATAVTLYPRITTLAIKVTTNRLVNTSLTGGDYSFETRLNELTVIMDEFKRYPLSGVGIHSKFVSWDPIVQAHQNKSFAHIGYAWLLHKMGIGLTLLMAIVLCSFTALATITAFKVWTRDRYDSLVRGTAIGMFCVVPAILAFIAVSGFFDQRYGNVMLAITFALVSITSQHVQQAHSSMAASPFPTLSSRPT